MYSQTYKWSPRQAQLQDKSSETLDPSRLSLTPSEIKQSDDVNGINNLNEKSEASKPVLVYESITKDDIIDTDTNIAIKKLVSVAPYDDKDLVMTTNPFLATMSLWQSYISAWFRVCNEFFRYPTAITGEICFFRLNVKIRSEE
jgi:hypothetical protein